MSIINKKQINSLLEDEKLIITPILDEGQIGEASIDLRIGNIFKVSKQTREPFICVNNSAIVNFFDVTYREFGQDFILFPNQLVLASTFEFVKLPNNVMGQVFTRSSINRLGINIASIVQPGYAGTLTMELINKGESAVRIKSGMRFSQLILYEIASEEFESYSKIKGSKYIADTEPKISNIYNDYDLEVLAKMIK